jgi:hypothetical protein
VKTAALSWMRNTALKIETLFEILNKWFQQTTPQRNPFHASHKEVEQSRLVGLYLVHTNTKRVYSGQRFACRERLRGRNGQVRESVSRLAR